MADAFLLVEMLMCSPSTWDTAVSLMSKSHTGWIISRRLLNVSSVSDCVYIVSGNLLYLLRNRGAFCYS